MKKLKYLMTLAILLVIGVMIYYVCINKGNDKNEENGIGISEVDKVLAKDLENNYPLTAREVISYFTSIQKCYYNEEYTDDELVQLSYKARELFDDELAENNKFDEYYENLTLEIEEYKSANRTITKIILDKAAEVIYSELEGVKYAEMNCIYYIKTSGETTKVTEKYILRCDNDGRWKILGWDFYRPSEYDE